MDIDLPQLSDQERDSLLSRLANYGYSGVKFLGDVLGTVGRPVRTALGGRFEDVLPSIVDPSRAVSGEDLARQWGLNGVLKIPGTDIDLTGTALEIGLDPLTYATFGGSALTGAGKAAKAAGTLEKTLAGRIAAGQGGLMNLAGHTFGTGPTAQKVAQGLGSATDWLASTYPGRAASALFDRDIQGSTSKFLQPAFREAAEGLQGLQAEATLPIYQWQRQAQGAQSEVAKYQAQLASKGIDPRLVQTPEHVVTGIAEGVLQPQGGVLGGIGQQARDLYGTTLPSTGLRAGLDISPLADMFPRRLNPELMEGGSENFLRGLKKPQAPTDTTMLQRKVPTDLLTGKTLSAQAMSLDPTIAGALRANPNAQAQVEDAILRQYMGGVTRATASPEHLADAEQLAKIFGNLDPANVTKGVPFYDPNIYGTAIKHMNTRVETEQTSKAMLNMLAREAKPQAQLGPDAVPVTNVLKAAGFGPGATNLVNSTLHVPAEVANDLTRYIQSFSRPESISPFLDAFDRFTTAFKTGVSVAFPSSRVRDLWQNGFMYWVKGFGSEGVQPWVDSFNVFGRGGGVIKGAADIPAVKTALGKVTDEVATAYIADQAAAWKLVGAEKPSAAHAVAGLPGGTKAPLPGAARPLLSDIMAEAKAAPGAAANPLGLKGLGDWKTLGLTGPGRAETTFLPAKVGGRVIETIDDVSRGAAYLAGLRQGNSFEQAVRGATEAMYDYGNLSRAERSVMMRVVPFYNFMRQNIPAQIKELIQKPGGRLATTIKASEGLRESQGFVPEKVGEGVAVPVGGEVNGTQRFLSHFGLPWEEALGPVVPGNLQRTLQSALSETHPAIKGTVELATGRQMQSGKDLRDLYGSTGNQVLDQLVYNSPISRVVRTARTLADERKGVGAKALNLLSPLQITDVDMNKQRNIAAREALTEILKQNPNTRVFENLSVPKDKRDQLTPQELQALALYQSLSQRRPTP